MSYPARHIGTAQRVNLRFWGYERIQGGLSACHELMGMLRTALYYDMYVNLPQQNLMIMHDTVVL